MSLAVPTALQPTYDHLSTVSSAVAQRYVEVATVVQPAFTPAEFATLGLSTVCNWRRVAGGPGSAPECFPAAQSIACSSAWPPTTSGSGPSTAWPGTTCRGGGGVLAGREAAPPVLLAQVVFAPGWPPAAPILSRGRSWRWLPSIFFVSVHISMGIMPCPRQRTGQLGPSPATGAGPRSLLRSQPI